MPQRRYYCDYCGRSFVDSKEKRDAHFQSQLHQNNVRMWYESKRETAAAVQRSKTQQVCMTFKKSGFCRLGNKCPYRHVAITDDIRDGFSVIPDGMLETTVRPIEDTPWIPVETNPNYALDAIEVREDPKMDERGEEESAPQTFRERFLPLRVDLPPSLLPVHSSVFESAPPVEWG